MMLYPYPCMIAHMDLYRRSTSSRSSPKLRIRKSHLISDHVACLYYPHRQTTLPDTQQTTKQHPKSNRCFFTLCHVVEKAARDTDILPSLWAYACISDVPIYDRYCAI